jgi:hypothetical protein
VRDPPQKTLQRRPGSGLSCGWPPCGE